jgi:CBS-domain-containing membrane protein
MKNVLEKLRGNNAELPARASLRAIVLTGLSGGIVIAALGLMTQAVSLPLMLGSFGASSLLVFGYPDAPFSQPRNVVFGHVLASLIGLVFLWLFGPVWWAMGLALGTTIIALMLTRTVHPPASSNPIIIFLTQSSWSFLLLPTLLGALFIVAVAVVYNNSVRNEQYPRYW